MKSKGKYPGKTQEERKKELTELEDLLEKGVEKAMDTGSYRMLLDTAARFHRYSVNNMLLIFMQKPDASFVAGFKTWQKLGRHISKGEQALKVFAPAFRKIMVNVEKTDEQTGEKTVEKVEKTLELYKAVSVFDVSQTEGEDIKGLTGTTLRGDVEEYERMIDALCASTDAKVTFGEVTGLARGYYDPVNHFIRIKDGMPKLQTVKTLAHEIAHSVLHRVETGMERGQKELEAESVAFIFCRHFGLDTEDACFDYIAGWAEENGTEKLRKSLARIHETASALIEDTEKAFCSGEEMSA